MTEPEAALNISDLLDESEAAQYCRPRKKTLQAWRSARIKSKPPLVKVGRRVFYRRFDLEAWIVSNTYYSLVTKCTVL